VAGLPILLSAACSAGRSPAKPVPGGPPTEPADLLTQAAEQARFTLLVPNQANLPFDTEPAGVEILSQAGTGPFIVQQTYQAGANQIHITQSSLLTGRPPLKATAEVAVRGGTGYWLVLNTGERILYWEEPDSSLTLGGDLAQEDLLALAEALTPYE
jgi:hypothetical protein